MTISCSDNDIVSRANEEAQSNFGLSTYKDASGKSNPCYLLTRDGFTFTAMGFTGVKARAACAVACCAGSCGQKEARLTRDMSEARFVPCGPFGEVGSGHKLPMLDRVVCVFPVRLGDIPHAQP
jgi:hypothetical protein